MSNPQTQTNFPQGQELNLQGQKQNTGSTHEEQSIPQAQTPFPRDQELFPQELEQNTKGDILLEENSIFQVPDYLSSPQSLKINLNVEKKTELIEENSLSSLAPTNSINMVLEGKIKEEGKGVHSFNINPNRFKSPNRLWLFLKEKIGYNFI